MRGIIFGKIGSNHGDSEFSVLLKFNMSTQDLNAERPSTT